MEEGDIEIIGNKQGEGNVQTVAKNIEGEGDISISGNTQRS